MMPPPGLQIHLGPRMTLIFDLWPSDPKVDRFMPLPRGTGVPTLCKNRFIYGWGSLELGNAIPDRFANPGISGLSLLNPGIPGLNRVRLWLAIAGLVIGKIATTRTTRYRLNFAMHIVIGRLSCTFFRWRMVLNSTLNSSSSCRLDTFTAWTTVTDQFWTLWPSWLSL